MSIESTNTLVLTSRDVANIVGRVGCDYFMDEMIKRLQRAFEIYDPSRVTVPVRDGFHYSQPQTGLLEWMPIHQHGRGVLVKMVGYHPHNPIRHCLPTVLSAFSLFDTSTGRLLAFVDGVLLTAIRTGAASAVATRLLARNDGGCVGIIGCGAQAVTQLHALSRIMSISEVRCYDKNPAVMESFGKRISSCIGDSPLLLSPTPEEVASESDVLCTATSVDVAAGPVFKFVSTREHLHVNAVGSDLAGKTELPRLLLEQSLVCPDFPEQAQKEGECQQLNADQIGPSLLQVAANPNHWRAATTRRTVFDSTGWALEDAVATELVMDLAVTLEIGTRMSVDSDISDPWNPYAEVAGDVNSEASQQQQTAHGALY